MVDQAEKVPAGQLRAIAAWALERLIELFLASYLVLMVLGSNENPARPGFWGDMYTNSILVLFFFVSSGYVFTSLYVALSSRVLGVVKVEYANMLLFLAHASLFLLFFAGAEIIEAVALLLLGVAIVALSGHGGRIIRNR